VREAFVQLRIIRHLAVAALAFTAASNAASRKNLHTFGGDPDGAGPESDLVMDAQGNLYGTTYLGGTGPCDGGCGTVFELSPDAAGGYTERVIHSFEGSLVDGQMPEAPLIFDAEGNLYGTTLSGGQKVTAAAGTVFKLTRHPGGDWTETVLHSFNGALDGGKDGGQPQAGLIFDAAGNLYGTTAGGGTGAGCVGGNGCGTVFELSPAAGGAWHETILHNFTNDHTDGWIPQSTLIMDAAGSLYGTTFYGGSSPAGGGTVFRLSRTSNGWQEDILYNFRCAADGCSPYSGVAFDADGNLYGTTVGGGANPARGVVYKLAPAAAGAWTQSVLHAFGETSSDGILPYGKPIVDAAGNVYGTTFYGGGGESSVCSDGCGTVFKLTPNGAGGYTESILSRFGNGSQGSSPLTGLLMDGAGNLYGTAAFGGAHGGGVVFEIIF
jgi:uncharacterized repeat protein (TIGR03803 family)